MIEMLQQPFFRNALIASILLSSICSFLGVYVVLRRVVFVGLALAQVSSAGVALSYLAGVNPIFLPMILTLGGVAIFSSIPHERRIPMEGIIGVGYVLAAALAILFVAKNPTGEARIINILFGNILTVSTADIIVMICIFALVGAVHYFFYKEFIYVSFDEEMAMAQGVRAGFWNLSLFLTVGVVISIGIKSAGPLLIFAFLVMPPITARVLAGRMRTVFILSVAFGGLASFLGLFLSVRLDMPATSTIVATSGALLLIAASLKFASERLHSAVPAAGFLALALVLVLPSASTAEEGDQGFQRLQQEVKDLRGTVEQLRETVAQQQEMIREGADKIREIEYKRREPVMEPADGAAATGPEYAEPVNTGYDGGRAEDERGTFDDSGGYLMAQETEKGTGPPLSEKEKSAVSKILESLKGAGPGQQQISAAQKWLPDFRVEANFNANKTWNGERGIEGGKDVDLGYTPNHFSMKEIELGLQSMIDPFARADVSISFEPDDVSLEEGYLTALTLPLGFQAKIGKFRSSFGEINDEDPDEFPWVDRPWVLINFFGEDGDLETGINLNTQVPLPWDAHSLWWLGIFNGDNDVAFSGGQADKLTYMGRLELFKQTGPASGLEFELGVITGPNDPQGELRTTMESFHAEWEWKHPKLGMYKSFGFMTEFFLSQREMGDETVNSLGMYSLAHYQLTRRWFVTGRYDYSELPTNDELRETGFSTMLTFAPSRFSKFRVQYKHTDRNFGEDADEVFFQYLYIVGFERPGPF